MTKVNEFIKDPKKYLKKQAEIKEKELEKLAKKKALEFQLNLIKKVVEKVWPKVDPHKTGKIGKD
jgi:hypothetical protein